MATPSSVKELKYRLEKAEARENYKKTQKTTAPAAYKGKPDRTTFVYRDWLNAGLYVSVDINTQTIAALGGEVAAAALLGLYTTAAIAAMPAATRPTPIPNRNIRTPMFRMRWFYGDNVPTVKGTPWGTRVVSFADQKYGLKYHQVYIAKTEATFTFDDVVAAFTAFWTNARITDLLGAKGRAELMFGDEVVATIKD